MQRERDADQAPAIQVMQAVVLDFMEHSRVSSAVPHPNSYLLQSMR
jgi:hypothetical protein